jgi:hypothetical protein
MGSGISPPGIIQPRKLAPAADIHNIRLEPGKEGLRELLGRIW